jgi:hypothetical protein
MILFNHKYRIVGYVFLMPAIGILIAKNVFKQSLDFLYLPVFAIQSTFTETKYFFWMHSNLSDEIFTIFSIIGLTLIALSKEKQENAQNTELRLKALSLAFIINAAFIVFGSAFFYGLSYLYILTINIFSIPLLYIIIFRILLYKSKKSRTKDLVTDGFDN